MCVNIACNFIVYSLNYNGCLVQTLIYIFINILNRLDYSANLNINI